MKRVTCGYCRKLVRIKPLFGTRHWCLSPADRQMVDWARMQSMDKPQDFEAWLSQFMTGGGRGGLWPR